MRWNFSILAALGIVGIIFACQQSDPPALRGKTVWQWMDQLSDPDYVAREQARVTLIEMGKDATPHLLRALQQRDSGLHKQAFRLSTHAGWQLISRPVAHERRASVAALIPSLGERGGEAIPLLVELLDDPHKPAAQEVECALRKLGEPAVAELKLALVSSREALRRTAARMMRDFEPRPVESIPLLITATRDASASVRAEAAKSLGVLAIAFEPTGPALLALLDDADPEVRSAGAAALGNLKIEGKPAVPRLMSALRDLNGETRLRAAEAIWKITGEADRALPVLCECLSMDSLRWEAALVLGRIGSPAEPAIPALVAALKAERVHRPLRFTAGTSDALARIGPAAVPALVEVLSDPRPHVQLSAAAALGNIGEAARPATPALLHVLQQSSGDLKLTVTLSLVEIGAIDAKLAPALEEMSLAGEDHLRTAALDALGRLQSLTMAESNGTP